MLLEMHCVRPWLRRHSKEAMPEKLLGAGHSSPASPGCRRGCCKPVPITGMLPHAADVQGACSWLDGFPGVGLRIENTIMCCCTSWQWLGKYKVVAAVPAVPPGPGPQLHRSIFLHRGVGLNDPRWCVVFAEWMMPAWMCVYLPFGMCMDVYISICIQVKVHVKAEDALKIQSSLNNMKHLAIL